MTLTERLPQIIQTSFGRYKGEIVDWGYSFPRKWNLIRQVSAEPATLPHLKRIESD